MDQEKEQTLKGRDGYDDEECFILDNDHSRSIADEKIDQMQAHGDDMSSNYSVDFDSEQEQEQVSSSQQQRKDQLDELQQENDQLHLENQQQLHQLTQLRRENQDLKEESQRQEQVLDDLQQENDQLHLEKQQYLHQLTQLQRENHVVEGEEQQKLVQQLEELQQESARCHKEKQEQGQQLNQLLQETHELREEISQQKGRLGELQQENDRLQEKNQRYQEQVEEMEEEKLLQDQSHQTVVTEMASVQEKYDEANVKLTTATERLEIQQETISHYSKHQHRLQDELGQVKTHNLQYQQELAQAQEKLEKLHKEVWELRSVQEQYLELKENFCKANQRYTDLELSYKTLNVQFEALEHQVNSQQATITTSIALQRRCGLQLLHYISTLHPLKSHSLVLRFKQWQLSALQHRFLLLKAGFYQKLARGLRTVQHQAYARAWTQLNGGSEFQKIRATSERLSNELHEAKDLIMDITKSKNMSEKLIETQSQSLVALQTQLQTLSRQLCGAKHRFIVHKLVDLERADCKTWFLNWIVYWKMKKMGKRASEEHQLVREQLAAEEEMVCALKQINQTLSDQMFDTKTAMKEKERTIEAMTKRLIKEENRVAELLYKRSIEYLVHVIEFRPEIRNVFVSKPMIDVAFQKLMDQLHYAFALYARKFNENLSTEPMMTPKGLLHLIQEYALFGRESFQCESILQKVQEFAKTEFNFHQFISGLGSLIMLLFRSLDRSDYDKRSKDVWTKLASIQAFLASNQTRITPLPECVEIADPPIEQAKATTIVDELEVCRLEAPVDENVLRQLPESLFSISEDEMLDRLNVLTVKDVLATSRYYIEAVFHKYASRMVNQTTESREDVMDYSAVLKFTVECHLCPRVLQRGQIAHVFGASVAEEQVNYLSVDTFIDFLGRLALTAYHNRCEEWTSREMIATLLLETKILDNEVCYLGPKFEQVLVGLFSHFSSVCEGIPMLTEENFLSLVSDQALEKPELAASYQAVYQSIVNIHPSKRIQYMTFTMLCNALSQIQSQVDTKTQYEGKGDAVSSWILHQADV